MRYQLGINLTEEEYIDFNIFHAMESITAKNQLKKAA